LEQNLKMILGVIKVIMVGKWPRTIQAAEAKAIAMSSANHQAQKLKHVME